MRAQTDSLQIWGLSILIIELGSSPISQNRLSGLRPVSYFPFITFFKPLYAETISFSENREGRKQKPSLNNSYSNLILKKMQK